MLKLQPTSLAPTPPRPSRLPNLNRRPRRAASRLWTPTWNSIRRRLANSEVDTACPHQKAKLREERRHRKQSKTQRAPSPQPKPRLRSLPKPQTRRQRSRTARQVPTSFLSPQSFTRNKRAPSAHTPRYRPRQEPRVEVEPSCGRPCTYALRCDAGGHTSVPAVGERARPRARGGR